MLKIRVGGVPEHFNLPWHLAMEQGAFKKAGIDLEWITYKGGTGVMCQALRSDEVDVCVILTEGIIRDVIHGNPSKIISGYIDTPLIWGVHTGAKNQLQNIQEIYDKRYAISRNGSGSHLMPLVDAMINRKEITPENMLIVNNLDGALESLEELNTDVFYWEKYTTKPYVDSGQLRILGEFVTPWPCFMLAASDKIISTASFELGILVDTIQKMAHQFVQEPNAVQILSKRYQQEYQDIENWFHSTEWSENRIISIKMLNNVLHSLKKASLINQDYSFKAEQIIHHIPS